MRFRITIQVFILLLATNPVIAKNSKYQGSMSEGEYIGVIIDDVTDRLVSTGWTKKQARSIANNYGSMLVIDTETGYYDLILTNWGAFGKSSNRNVKKFIGNYPDVIDIFVTDNDPEQLVATIKGVSRRKDDIRSIINLFTGYAYPNEVDAFERALKLYPNFIKSFLQHSSRVFIIDQFVTEYPDKGTLIFEEWMMENFNRALDDTEATNIADFLSVINLHGRYLRHRLREDPSFRDSFQARWRVLSSHIHNNKNKHALVEFLEHPGVWDIAALSDANLILSSSFFSPSESAFLLYGLRDLVKAGEPIAVKKLIPPHLELAAKVISKGGQLEKVALAVFRDVRPYKTITARQDLSDSAKRCLLKRALDRARVSARTQKNDILNEYETTQGLVQFEEEAGLSTKGVAHEDYCGVVDDSILSYVPIVDSGRSIWMRYEAGLDQSVIDWVVAGIDTVFIFAPGMTTLARSTSKKPLKEIVKYVGKSTRVKTSGGIITRRVGTEGVIGIHRYIHGEVKRLAKDTAISIQKYASSRASQGLPPSKTAALLRKIGGSLGIGKDGWLRLIPNKSREAAIFNRYVQEGVEGGAVRLLFQRVRYPTVFPSESLENKTND